MNKHIFAKIVSIAALVGVVALIGAAVTFAQFDAPTPIPPVGGERSGMPGDYDYGPGMRRGYRPGMTGSYGFMAEYWGQMHAKLAEALGMTPDEFHAALAQGKTPYQIADEKGMDFAALQAAMQAAHAGGGWPMMYSGGMMGGRGYFNGLQQPFATPGP